MTKKLVFLCAIALGITLQAEAQAVKYGQQFWDGVAMYTVTTMAANGDATLTGSMPEDWRYPGYTDWTIKLEAVGHGNYTLQPTGSTPCPFRCKWGSKVRFIHESGMNFLAVYNSKEEMVEALVLTPDNLAQCAAQQQEMQSYMASEGLMEADGNFLLNSHLTTGCSMEDLQAEAMRMGGLAKPSVIERANLELLFSEIAYRNGEAEGGYDNPDGPGADGKGPDEVE